MIADSLRASPLELLSLGGEVEATEVLADPLATSPSPPPPSTPVVLASEDFERPPLLAMDARTALLASVLYFSTTLEDSESRRTRAFAASTKSPSSLDCRSNRSKPRLWMVFVMLSFFMLF